MKQPEYINEKKENNKILSNIENQFLFLTNNKESSQTNIALNNILNELKILNKNFNANEIDENESILKFSALVIDRFCLWFISILTLFSTCFVLFTSKNFFKFT